MDARGRAAVVGAGIFGAAAALELAERGWSVRLVDPGPLPRPEAASTDVSKLIRAEYGDDVFYTRLAERAIDGWDEWNRRWDTPLFHRTGLLLLTRDEPEPGGFEYESHRTLTDRGHELRPVGPEVLRHEFPAWSDGTLRAGYFDPGAGWAESSRVVARLIHRARDQGVEVDGGRTVERVAKEAGRVSGVRTVDGSKLPADVVVAAVGAWTPKLVPDLDDVMWATGQPVLHLHVENPSRYRPPAFPPWTGDIARTGWYGFSALDDGTLKVGHHGPGRRVDPDDLRIVEPEWERRCRGFLSEAAPGLSDAPVVSTRLCLYCDTFDSDFWIDRHPDLEGLVVAAGGSGHGFKFAPLLGGLIADAVEGRKNRWAHRFRWRDPGEERTEAARASGP